MVSLSRCDLQLVSRALRTSRSRSSSSQCLCTVACDEYVSYNYSVLIRILRLRLVNTNTNTSNLDPEIASFLRRLVTCTGIQDPCTL